MKEKNAPKDEREKILTLWQEEKTDGDFYKEKFIYLTSLSYRYNNLEDVEISKDMNYSFYPDFLDEENFFVVYPSYLISVNHLIKAVNFIEEGIKAFPLRFDLWDSYIKTLEKEYLYLEEGPIIINLLNLYDSMNSSNIYTLYSLHNEKIIDNKEDFISFIYNYINERISIISSDIPDLYTASLIKERAKSSFPKLF